MKFLNKEQLKRLKEVASKASAFLGNNSYHLICFIIKIFEELAFIIRGKRIKNKSIDKIKKKFHKAFCKSTHAKLRLVGKKVKRKIKKK